MGVMQCDRAGCGQIMCDRLVTVRNEDGRETRWRICYRCWGELATQSETWPSTLGREDVLDRITAFMGHERVPPPEPEEATTTRWFEELTKQPEDWWNT